MASKKTSSKTKAPERLILLDAHAIIHRAYHALPDFTSPSGEPTGALYGLAAMLIKIIQELKPDYLIACYDLPEPTHRHQVYEDYKAGRAKTDAALTKQLDTSRNVFTAFHIPIYEAAGFEADDILGTIVEKEKKNKDLEIIIASGDMDTLQLVDKKKVQVYTLRKGIQDTVLYDEKAVETRFGFGPELLPDYKGLRGDPSDNIPGVPGIGEKTATTLIENFGTIEQMHTLLKKGDEAFLEVGIKPRIVNLLKEHDEDALFSKMLGTIRRDAPIDWQLPKASWQKSVAPEAILDLFSEHGFRTLSRRIEELFQLSIEEAPEEEPEEVSPADEREVCVMLFVLRSDMTNPSLEDVYQFTKTKTVAAAKEALLAALAKENLQSVYVDIEAPLFPVLDAMHERGIKLDVAYLKQLSKDYHKELAKLEKRIHKHAGTDFNINSPRQLGEVLFDKLELKAKNLKKTSTGQRSTRESELEKLRGEHPIIDDIFAYRELQKLLSTYIDTLPTLVDKEDRVHTTLVQTGAATGRMASHNPNLQNIPIKTELGRHIRKAFVATRGFELVACDYSQIELRIAAFLSGDKKLIDIFTHQGDIHRAVAAEVFGVPTDKVDSEMRRQAKVINFGILYGMGVNALRQNLGTTRAEAQEFYNEYFKHYSGLAHYLDHTKALAARNGYTETLSGRRRYFEGINSSLPFIRAQAERMAINAPIQGTSADITKLAMRRVYDYLVQEKLTKDVHLILQVHDELLFEIRKDHVKTVVPKLTQLMEDVYSLDQTKGIRLVVDAKHGQNWEDLQPLSLT